MNPAQHHVFSLQEAAQAYSMTASRILGTDVDFLEQNQMVIPIFVSMLFQSVEVSLKSVGIESGLITREEARDRKSTRSGHGIKEIAQLMSQKLGDQRETSVVMALTSACNKENIATYVREMIYGDRLEKTRLAYSHRRLGYGEVSNGDFALCYPLDEWVASVQSVADNLASAAKIIEQWRSSASDSPIFAVWYSDHSSRGRIRGQSPLSAIEN
jgi:hypothetical protein